MRKIIPFILILVILAGLFSPTKEVNAQAGTCAITYPREADSPAYTQRIKVENDVACQEYARVATGGRGVFTPDDGSPSTIVTASTQNGDSGNDFGCVFPFVTRMGCLAGFSYILWTISAFMAELAGRFLDFFVYYSTNSSSYSNVFVEKGWGIVRDVANIFFIIALLYIAVKTVLSLEGSHSKKMIANIIIIALIINFSLFTTKVVIDATNILAKVFYNSITPVGPDGGPTKGGQKSISIGLIRSYNPTTIIAVQKDYNAGQFTFVTILLLIITIYTTYVFLAVALLFVGRVVSLWMSMIFAPLAFISYTVPFDIPGFGHKKWWDDLLKSAFLAPLFVFFLYIIVMFTNFLPDVAEESIDKANVTQHVMSVMIPFVILMALLMKAKKLAVDYAGDMGKAVMKGAQIIGGVAGGLTIGGVAALGQGTLGHWGKMANESAKLKKWETEGNWAQKRLGGMARSLGGTAASGSFDLRQGAAGVGLKTVGAVTGLNLGQQSKLLLKEAGGYEADLKRRDDKRKKRAEGLKVTDAEPEKQELNRLKEKHQTVSLDNEHDLQRIKNALEGAKAKAESLKNYADSWTGSKKQNEDGTYQDSEYANRMVAYNDATTKVRSLLNERDDVKNGGEKMKEVTDPVTGQKTMVGTGVYRTVDGKISQSEVARKEEQAKETEAQRVAAEKAKSDAPALHDAAKQAQVLADGEAAAAAVEVERVKRSASLTNDPNSAENIAAIEAASAAKVKADEAAAKAATNVKNAFDNIAKTAETAKITTARAETAAKLSDYANTAAKKGTSHSQNDYEDKLIPEADRKVRKIDNARIGNYANTVENEGPFWSRGERKRSAHGIRMRVEREKERGGGHGGGFPREFLASAVAEKVFGGSHSHPSAKQTGEGGGGK